jgi:hypothetical protein
VSGDREPFQDLVRVGPHERAILERRGLSLCSVADGEPRSGPCCSDRAPLLAGREAGPTSATQAALRDLVDDGLRRGTQGNLESPASACLLILAEGSDGLAEECHVLSVLGSGLLTLGGRI